MQFLDLKNQLKNFLVFSIKDIEKVDLSFHKQRLSEWQKKGYVKKIRQGFYMFSDLPINEQILYAVANRIYEPSYISLEMALSIYGLIPEAVYGITSVTTQNTKTLKTPVGDFMYRHVRPGLMFGYELREYEGHRYQVAEMEKAVLDYLYLNARFKSAEDFKGLRLNTAEFKERANMEKLYKYLEAFRNRALAERVRSFLTYIEHA